MEKDMLGTLIRRIVDLPIEVLRVLDDLVGKLLNENGQQWLSELKKFLRKEECWIPRWTEREGVIYFSVTSDGTTGPQWIERLKKKGFRISDWAESLLKSDDFKPTNGVTTEVAVLKGMLWKDSDRITSNIRAEADKRKLEKPNAEVACLIRERLADEDIEAMGLWWIVTMHEPIKDSDGVLRLLLAHRSDGGRWLSTAYGSSDIRWRDDAGFAFVAPQVSP